MGAAATGSATPGRRCRARCPHRREDRQTPDRTFVPRRTGRRIIGFGHRTAHFEDLVTGPTAEFVERHGASVGIWLTDTMSRIVVNVSTNTDLERDLEQDLRTGEPTCAHIVKTEPGENAQAKVIEARIYGTPLEALCGHVWVPSRDPKQLPLCEDCKAIYEMYRMMNDGLHERPSD